MFFLQQKPFQQQSTSCSASIAYLHVCRSAGKHAYERFHQRQVPVPQHDFGHAGRQNQSSGFAQQFNVNACSTGTSTAGRYRRRQKTEDKRKQTERTKNNKEQCQWYTPLLSLPSLNIILPGCFVHQGTTEFCRQRFNRCSLVKHFHLGEGLVHVHENALFPLLQVEQRGRSSRGQRVRVHFQMFTGFDVPVRQKKGGARLGLGRYLGALGIGEWGCWG